MWSRLTPRPSSSIRALVFLVFGEVTPSWSSFTRGSPDKDLRLTSPGPELGLGLEMVLEDSCSDGIFRLALGAEVGDSEDDGLGVTEELDLLVGSLEMGLGRSPEPWLGLDPLWCSEEGLILGDGAEEALGVDVALGLGVAEDVRIGLDTGLLVVGLTEMLLSLSLSWLLYELRLGSLYRSTVKTFP